jgi:hypothetical protein
MTETLEIGDHGGQRGPNQAPAFDPDWKWGLIELLATRCARIQGLPRKGSPEAHMLEMTSTTRAANQAARSGYKSGTVVSSTNSPPLVAVAVRAQAHTTVSATTAVNAHVLPADPQSDRWTRRRQGDRAQVGMLGLQDAQIRPGLCDPVNGGVRGQDQGQDGGNAQAAGSSNGLPTESAAHKLTTSIEAVAIARQARDHAQRRETRSSGIRHKCRGIGGNCRRLRIKIPRNNFSAQ